MYSPYVKIVIPERLNPVINSAEGSPCQDIKATPKSEINAATNKMMDFFSLKKAIIKKLTNIGYKKCTVVARPLAIYS